MTVLPLQGYTVADFTQVWAGPQGTGLLADMGASVIRVESQAGSDAGRSPAALELLSEQRRRLNSIWYHRNRQHYVTLNFSKPRGAELAKEIVKRSDVVVENFSPRVLKSFGLGYDDLRKVRPDLIMVSMSACGQTGPLQDVLSYGPAVNCIAGTNGLVGYPGEEQPMEIIWDPDPTMAAMGVFAVLTALYHRKRTGQGQHIDLSFQEVLVGFLGEALMEHQMNGRVPGPHGNRHPVMVPHGYYPCQGEDKWVSIAVKTEEEWQALCRALGNPTWTRDRRFADVSSRLKHRDELDRLVGEWTSRRTPEEATEMLQKAGVAAFPALSVAELYHDPHDTYRRATVKSELPELKPGDITYGIPWRLSDTPGSIRRLTPLMGADNERFFTTVLGLSAEEVRRLEREQVIY